MDIDKINGLSFHSPSYLMRLLAYTAALSLAMVSLLGMDCSSRGDNDDASIEMPVDVTITNEPLTGGIPKTFTYSLPAPDTPLTDVNIDLVKTLEAARITVTP